MRPYRARGRCPGTRIRRTRIYAFSVLTGFIVSAITVRRTRRRFAVIPAAINAVVSCAARIWVCSALALRFVGPCRARGSCPGTRIRRTRINARMAYALVGIDAIVVIIAFSRLQVAFPAFAVFKAFASALFFAFVVDAFFVRFAAGIGNATIRYGLAAVIGQRFANAAGQIDALIIRTFLRRSAMAV